MTEPTQMYISETNRDISIEPLSSPHFALAADWFSDPESNRWLSSFWRGKRFQPSDIAVVAMNPRVRLYHVRYAGEPSAIMGFTNIDWVERSATIMSLVGNQAHRGKRIYFHTWGTLVKIGFEELGLQSLQRSVMESNRSSKSAGTGVGWRTVGVFRRGFCVNGEFIDRILMDLTPDDLRPDRLP